MEMEHYLEYIDNDVWKVIQNGNSKKRISTGKDGVVRILPPVSAAEIHAVEKERKARTILLMAYSKTYEGKDFIFEAFTISSSEGLENGYDRFQQLLLQLEAHGAEVSTEDANHKFLRSLPPTWSNLAMTMRTKPDVDTLSIDELIAMIAIRMKKFYKKTGRRVQIDGNKPVGFDKKKLECFKCHNTSHFTRECPSNGTNDGKKSDSFYQDQGAEKKEQNQKLFADYGCRCMTSNSKVGLGYEIQSNNEVLSYEEEMNRTVFKCTEEDFLNKPLYSRFSKTNNFKGVPHPLYGDYTLKPQEEIDDSLYVYGKKGPQKPEISNSDDNSTKDSTSQSNDSE
ncbi:ribonuclease H-like domain-containing protein [Tanacetum coccineum]